MDKLNLIGQFRSKDKNLSVSNSSLGHAQHSVPGKLT